MNEMLIVVLFILVLLLAYWVRILWKALKWIMMHVQVVSKRDMNDPGLTRIKQLFGIEEKEE